MKKLWFKTYLTFDALRRAFIETGWLKSIWTGNIETREGSALPWLSYPAIHFLNSLDLKGAHIFEFGSGNSTLYWRDRWRTGEIRHYAAVEPCEDYFREMYVKDGFYRDHVRYAGVMEDYFIFATRQAFVPERPFDFCFVDGPILTHRARELEAALQITDSTGVIVVDDAQWMTETLEKFCADHHFFRIDFAGHSPGTSYTKLTSFLFREPFWFTASRLTTPVAGMPNFPGMK